MPSFPKPSPALSINASKEKSALTKHFKDRKVPSSTDKNLLLASWNIANLGEQKRGAPAAAVIAHILKRFDLIAVQEVKDNFRDFTNIVALMGSKYDFVMSDTAGNNERLAYIFNTKKILPSNLFGEIALRPREYPKHTVQAHYRQGGVDKVQTFRNLRYTPFDRNPFIGSFTTGNFEIVMANVHLYFGAFQNSTSEANRKKYARRVLEIYALADWANDRSKGGNAWNKAVVLLGDMNVPNMENNEATLKALQKFGWKSVRFFDGTQTATTDSLTRVGGSNLGNDRTYDQIAFAPNSLQSQVVSHGVFDYDQAVFKSKWSQLAGNLSHKKAVTAFNRYLKFYISDHRPVWVELSL